MSALRTARRLLSLQQPGAAWVSAHFARDAAPQLFSAPVRLLSSSTGAWSRGGGEGVPPREGSSPEEVPGLDVDPNRVPPVRGDSPVAESKDQADDTAAKSNAAYKKGPLPRGPLSAVEQGASVTPPQTPPDTGARRDDSHKELADSEFGEPPGTGKK